MSPRGDAAPGGAGTGLRGVRVAVTGASGFCGSAVARAAADAGADVVCLGRRPGPVGRHLRWDAARETPELAGADVVIHLAAAVGDPAPGRAAEAAYRAVNVDGTARLLDAAGDRPVVWVSSASVYDPRVRAGTIREEHPIGGQLTAYGRTKAAGERLALDAGAVVLRPRAVYGPGDPHLLPRLARAVRGGRVLLPGPDVSLSLTAVENLADACLAAPHWPAGAYNVADGRAYRRDAVVAEVLAATGRPARVRHVPAGLGYAAAAAATALSRLTRSGPPTLTRYAIDQLAHGVVLDIGRARGRGWSPRRSFPDFVAALRADPRGMC
ncbi:Nucleoside-diphosphate-sugar epimerase [Micromonospora pattaloongensis]|uniref:Nucleoside-diphosphate-sugar epimerase n=1 Tax=Micromonospora pattaloongensis TaxID=405436 RepID=A0A1H3JA04_9ACTN|nr:NAD-dependent epimerase/dehydratase family protein [Micromonospora pattaloongensis]SDY36781.1 Nucleoside-diphosphate-sugar epimerase [Micromonospora pattaloongensis]